MAVCEPVREALERAGAFVALACVDVRGAVGAVAEAEGATPVPPEAPKFADIKLIDYDQAKYGKSAERKRLIARWDAEVGALPKP